MSYRNLQYMRQFADEFSLDEIMQQPAAQIPWFTLITILEKCSNQESRLWYINKTYEYGWSRSDLTKQIKAKAYERNMIEPIVSKGIKDYDNKLIDKEIRSEIDNKTIGILLCRNGESYVIKSTFESEETPLIYTEYILLDKLDDYLEKNKKE